MPNNNDYVSDVIAQAALKNKFLEFKDALVPAFTKDYAMLQGAVGKDHAPNSGIRVLITDYSDKDKTKQVGALIPCYVFEQIKDICKKNNGTMLLEGDIPGLVTSGNRLALSYGTLLKGITLGLRKLFKKEEEPVIAFGSAVKDALAKFTDESAGVCGSVAIPMACDWNYNQVRVNSSHPNADGTVPCSTAVISHVTRDSNGTAYRNPWSFTITKFNAEKKEHDNGTVSYDSKTIKDKTELQCSLSNDDMSRCVYAVEHFIAQWERANLPSFTEGLNARRDQFKKL